MNDPTFHLREESSKQSTEEANGAHSGGVGHGSAGVGVGGSCAGAGAAVAA